MAIVDAGTDGAHEMECIDGHIWHATATDSFTTTYGVGYTFEFGDTVCPRPGCGLLAHEDGKDGIRLPSAVRRGLPCP